MKETIIAVLLFVALTVYFSFFGLSPAEKTNGPGTQHKGDFGIVIPGDGDLLAEVSFEQNFTSEHSEHKGDSSETTSSESTEPPEEVHTEITEKEEITMDNSMLLAFWHGVIAVLIGEASALAVSFIWARIKGDTAR